MIQRGASKSRPDAISSSWIKRRDHRKRAYDMIAGSQDDGTIHGVLAVVISAQPTSQLMKNLNIPET